MNNSINELDLIEFKEEIAHKLELDFNRDIFDLIAEVEDIIAEKKQILEYDDRQHITLNKLNTSNLENIKAIECFYISIRDNNDYDNYLNIIFDDYDKARQYFDNYISIKTLDDWNKSKYNYFEDFVKPGDKVSQDIVDYFSNSVSPITFKNDFVQAGEPYSVINF